MTVLRQNTVREKGSSNDSNSQKWALSIRIFHWLSAFMLVGSWASIEFGNNIMLHKALGVSILLWVVARLINRLFRKDIPHLPAPKWQNFIASLTHCVLYSLLFAMPIVGILMSMYGGQSISMFGIFEIPVMVTPDRSMSKLFRNAHEDIIWPMLLLFTALHVVGALYHQFILKDNLISRMR